MDQTKPTKKASDQGCDHYITSRSLVGNTRGIVVFPRFYSQLSDIWFQLEREKNKTSPATTACFFNFLTAVPVYSHTQMFS